MKVFRERHFTVNMGESSFESYRFGGAIEYTHADLGFTDEQWSALPVKERADYAEQLTNMVSEHLTLFLEDEIQSTALATKYQNSFVKRALRK